MKKIYKWEHFKISILVFMLVICLFGTYYFHFILKTEIIFTHFFYVPIILSALWWSRKGIATAVFLALMLLASHIISPFETPIRADIIRAFMFVAIGVVVATLTEKRCILEDKLLSYSKNLEHQVEERTKELREAQEKQRAILEGIADAVLVQDENLNITWANEVAVNQYGVVIGKRCSETYKQQEEPCADCIVKKTFADGISRSSEEEVVLKDGSRVNFIVSCAPVKDSEGNFVSVVEVFHDISERVRAEEMLLESENKYRTIFENTGTATVIIEEDRTMSLANAEFEKLSGYSRKEIEGKKKWTEFVVAEDLERMKDYHKQRRVDPTNAPREYEFRFIDRKGIIKDILLSIDVIPGTKKSVASLRDITERKRAEEKIKASLKEKKVLLQEIHHRVKNNMQIVSSLLRLQSRKVEDKKMQEVFRECQNRIRTMALIHEKLYQSKDFARINYAQYIDGLTVHVFQSYSIDSNIVNLKTDLEEIFLDLNRAIPCGLIVQELLSNSIKHAFPQGKKGEIRIKLHSDKKGVITLVVSDNGIGFPKDIDFQKAQSLGLQMVNDLTKQISGTIELDRKGGTTFKVVFSVNK